MQNDVTATVMRDFLTWARRSGREPVPDSDTVGLVLRLLSDELGVWGPADLQPGDVAELLLDVCPEAVPSEDPAGVLLTVRGLLDFAADTDRIPGETVAILQREVDEVEPAFLVAAEDDIDLFSVDHDDELPDFGDDVDLRELFDLPDRLPPLRLPSEPELAQAARSSRLLARTQQLAMWVGAGRPLDEDGELTPEDSLAAARDLGLAGPGQSLDGTASRELARLVDLAEEVGFIEFGETDATVTAAGQEWPDGADDTVLDEWQSALGALLRWSLLADAEFAGEIELDFTAAGVGFLPLFLAREDGVALAELNAMIREPAVAGLAPDEADTVWNAWMREHGNPAEVLYGRLEQLGAIDIENGVVRLTPLALEAMRLDMVESEIDVPVLPSPEEMTAADVVLVGRDGSARQLAREWASWSGLRTPDAAAVELLEVAATSGPAERIVATTLVSRCGDAAEPAWREALADTRLRPYAKKELTDIAGPDSDLEPTEQDLAWLLTDALADADEHCEPDELADLLTESVRAGDEHIFEHIWRLDHPNAGDVLTLVGQCHPDKAVAKAARKAGFKIASR